MNRVLAASRVGPVAYRLRGQAFSGKHQYDQAIADLTRAIEAMDLAATAFCWHYDRALAFQGRGDGVRAAADLAEAEQLEPERSTSIATVWQS